MNFQQIGLIVAVIVLFILPCNHVSSQEADGSSIPVGAASLAFVFDITGSMYDDLVQVIEGAAKILATTLARRETPLYNYVLVPFHDPDVGPVIVTTDPDEFQRELRDLYVQGGGDCPEMSISAVKLALDVSLPNSFIFVFTDARSKDYTLTPEVLAIIQQKQSQVIFVLTGDCGDATHPGYRAFEQIASTSSGQVFLLKKSQVNQVLNFVKVAIQARKVNLMSIDSDSPDNHVLNIPIDSKLREFTVSVSGENPTVELRDPSGNIMTRASGLRELLDIKNVRIVNVRKPLPGQWRLSVTSDSAHTIRTTGLSTSDFVAGFSRRRVNNMSKTDLRPIGGIPTYVLVNATDVNSPGGLSKLELVNLKGDLLAEYPLFMIPNKHNLYNVSLFVPPDEFFYVKVSGVDEKGFSLQRITPTALSPRAPTAPDVYMPDITRGYYDKTAVITCDVDSLISYTVQWYRDGIPQGFEQYFSEPAQATMEVPRASTYSEGIYTCNATNVAGSRAVQTYLDISEPPPIILPSINTSILPGGDAILDCIAYSDVDYNVTWLRPDLREIIRSGHKYHIFNNGSLLIRGVEAGDEGGYICRAANEGGHTDEVSNLRVQVAPVAFIQPSEHSFVTGETVNFTCRAEGFPAPKLYWLRNNKLMLPNERIVIVQGFFSIRNLQRGDEGEIECIASNPAGESSATSRLNFIEAPQITLYGKKVLVASGAQASLYCIADGIPHPKIRWFKGDVELQALSYVQITDSGQLTIFGTQELDAGQYRCVASNKAGSDEAVIDLEVGSEPEIVQSPFNIGADIGKNATMPCTATGRPAPKIHWQREDGKAIDFRGRFKQLPTGALFVRDLHIGDEGMYTCSAQNQFGVKEESAYLSITGVVRPLIAYTNPFIEVVKGSDAELRCVVLMGNPKPTLHWVKKGKVLEASDHFLKDTNGNVIITDIQEKHEGEYTCIASNVGGNATYVVIIDVQVPPALLKTENEDRKTNFSVVEGRGVVLPCKVSGDPRPDIMWFKDESPISEIDYHYFIREDGSLEIFSVDAGDTGRYRCTATNDAGDVDKVMDLFVEVPPTIGGEANEEYTVVENSTIILPCQVKGIPKPKIAWKKNFMNFNDTKNRFVFGELGLTIPDAKITDKAIYECTASNIAGNITKIITLIVQIPPIITSTGVTDIIVQKGNHVTLGCETVGNPTPKVTWRKGDATLNVLSIDIGQNLVGTGSLDIISTELKDAGKYVCISSNPAGSDSRDFLLTVHDPPSLPENLPNYTDVIAKNPVVLPCPAVGTPTPTITWYKDGQEITANEVGVTFLDDGSIELDNTEAEDSGTYECIAVNEAGRTSQKVDLKVLVPPEITVDTSSSGRPGSFKVIQYDPITITCPVKADPPPSITWLKDGLELNVEDVSKFIISEDRKHLTFFEAVIADTGIYTCVAANVAGSTEKDFDLEVHVPPIVDHNSASPNNMSVVIGHPLSINCPVSGIPPPRVTWYKDGELIKPDLDPNLKVLAEGRRLELTNARVSDTGRYKCTAENVAGETSKEYEVDVYVAPKINKPGEVGDHEVVTNKTVRLQCPASGIPLPTITWYKNSEQITRNTSRYLLLDNGWTLEITSAVVADSARFTCRAKNVAGVNEKSFDLSVLVPAKINRTMIDTNPKVIINQTHIINCPVEGIPLPEITWYKNEVILDSGVNPRYERLFNGRQLRVNRAQLTDTAEFSCKARNKAGNDQVYFHLEVLVPSKINEEDTDIVPKVVVNNSIQMYCPASGVPPPSITWYKEGAELTQQKNPNIQILDQGRILKIINAMLRDTGGYTCRATNEAGSSDLNFDLSVRVPPAIPDDLDTEPNVVLGGRTSINCPATGTPVPEIVWFKNRELIDFSTQNHLSLESDGRVLILEDVSIADTAVYTCEATNEAGQTARDFDLEVWVAPKIDETNLDMEPRVVKGHTTVLRCPADGIPFPHIQWLKDRQPVILDNRVQILKNGLQLKIKNTTESDTARYTCRAINSAGEDFIDIDLSVLDPPSIDESNAVYEPKVVVNRSVILECLVSGIPPPHVDWLKNDYPIVESERLILWTNGKQLEIHEAQVEDTAVYTCVASNEAGELVKNYQLTVLVPASIDESEVNEDLSVVQNRTIIINCPVSGIPSPFIMWLKDREPLLDFPYKNMRVTNGGQRLEVTNAQVHDGGRYTCVATNAAGQADLHFQVKVHVPPMITGSDDSNHLSVIKQDPINLECHVTGVPDPLITWLKDNEIIVMSDNPHLRLLSGRQILQIASSKVSDAGRYTCHTENEAGISEKFFDLEVYVPPKIAGSNRLQDVSVIINDALTMDCPAEGIPAPKIVWHRQHQIIPQYGNPSVRIIDGGHRLMLVNAQLLDKGDYSCSASNTAGNATLEYMVSVLVPPSIEDGSTHVAAIVNSRAALECVSDGLPRPKVKWEKDGVVFPTTGLRHRMLRSGSIAFTSVRMDDAGTYVCTATNTAGRKQKEILLDVQVPPQIIGEQPLQLKSIVGEGVNLPCQVIGSPIPRIMWQKGTSALTGSADYELQRNGTLHLKRTDTSDSGVYICIAQNNAGTAIGRVRLQVQVPPFIDVRQTDFVVQQDRDIVLPCSSSGIPSPEIIWQKNGEEISVSNYRYRILRSGWLAIPFSRAEDAGVFTCIAENEAGSDEANIYLTVQVPPAIVHERRLLTMHVGDTARIACEAIGIPQPQISWMKEGRTIRSSDGEYEILDSGMLVIDSLKAEDTGSYVCIAINVAGRDSQERLLRVQVPPEIIEHPEDHEVLQNGRIELRCGAQGIPTPTLSWQHNEKDIPSPPSVDGQSTYVIQNIRREDGGQYICIADNPAGRDQSLALVVIKVPPRVIVPPGEKAVTIAEKVIISCSVVDGDPRPKILWTKNGRPVALNQRIQQLNNGSLVIYNLTSSDAGEYKCVATNDAGSSEAWALLRVREPPSFIIEPQSRRLDQGSSVTFNCVAGGDPMPSLTWWKELTEVESRGRLSILQNNSLQIVASQVQDSGLYRCVASNKLGRTFVEATLTVVVHGMWSSWSQWGPCDKSCGTGVQLRTRTCDSPAPVNGGRDCIGPSLETKMCIDEDCPIDGGWGNWQTWQQCSATCDEGQRFRRRLCDNPVPQHGGQDCQSRGTESESCNIRPCPVDGEWGEWSSWHPCSVSCGDGYQEQYRYCDNPSSSHGGDDCTGFTTQRQSCRIQDCAVDGNWGQWSQWTGCSLSCGGGSRTRTRRCDSPVPQYGGIQCAGRHTQRDYCNNEPCPVHGNWSPWGLWGDCTLTCNSGQRKRFRTCTNPAPSNNGRPCIGSSEKSDYCNTQSCPANGEWNKWGSWSDCSKSCDQGTRQRVRSCQHPVHGGQPCIGENIAVTGCNLEPCYKIPKRAGGFLVGYINNIDINDATIAAEMIPTEDGTATRINATISNLPEQVASHMRHLISVLTPVYWTTAREVDGAYNGYSLNKGVFTREVQVEFATGEILKMVHYVKGVDADGILQLDIIVRGTVPEFSNAHTIYLAPYREDYIQTSPGSLYAHSSRMFRVNGHMLPYAWNHSITYEPELGAMPYLVETLYARDMNIEVNPKQGSIRYHLEASISPGSPSNQCPNGFILEPDGNFCEDNDECSDSPCSNYCHNAPGSFACSCPFGFLLDAEGRVCQDIDECTTNAADCSRNQECVNTIGSYQCAARCRRGYKRIANGQSCEDVDECVETPHVCEHRCRNLRGRYRCSCRKGYRLLRKGKCADVNECDRLPSPCSHDCTNTKGSYQCTCPAGFRLVSGAVCVDINECIEGDYSCFAEDECVNVEGGYKCIHFCQEGYERVGEGQCQDIDECISGRHRCYPNQKCINTEGNYQCICPRGFRSRGLGHPCLDIDECDTRHDLCSYKCMNTFGGFECICAPGQVRLADRKSCAGLEFLEPSQVKNIPLTERAQSDQSFPLDVDTSCQYGKCGYHRDKLSCPEGTRYSKDWHSCTDMDECAENPDNCQHNCTNTVGSFKCYCPPGYRVDNDGRNCQDVDECQELNIDCGSDKMCFNTLGEFACIKIPCPEKYMRDPLTNYCVLECIDSEFACPPDARYADVIEFRTLALPSGILAFQDLIRLIAYDQDNNKLTKTIFIILENDLKINFEIRLQDGTGIVYTLSPLEEKSVYRIKVQAKSYDNDRRNIQYQTTFIIHIAVSAYPY